MDETHGCAWVGEFSVYYFSGGAFSQGMGCFSSRLNSDRMIQTGLTVDNESAIVRANCS